MGHNYTNNNTFFIENSNLLGILNVLFAKYGNKFFF